NGSARNSRRATRARQRRHMITSIARRSQQGLIVRIRPDSAIKAAQRNAPPLQVISALQIVLDLDVHDDRTGLLNLADASQLHAIAETRGDVAGRSVGSEVA